MILDALIEAGALALAITTLFGGVALVPRRARAAINRAFHSVGL